MGCCLGNSQQIKLEEYLKAESKSVKHQHRILITGIDDVSLIKNAFIKFKYVANPNEFIKEQNNYEYLISGYMNNNIEIPMDILNIIYDYCSIHDIFNKLSSIQSFSYDMIHEDNTHTYDIIYYGEYINENPKFDWQLYCIENVIYIIDVMLFIDSYKSNKLSNINNDIKLLNEKNRFNAFVSKYKGSCIILTFIGLNQFIKEMNWFQLNTNNIHNKMQLITNFYDNICKFNTINRVHYILQFNSDGFRQFMLYITSLLHTFSFKSVISRTGLLSFQ